MTIYIEEARHSPFEAQEASNRVASSQIPLAKR
jgi:hypothetical protein